MPELPEVESIRRTFEPHLVGRTITAFASSWPRQVEPSVPALRTAIVGRTISALSRRGKLLVFSLDTGRHFLLHLRMSGRLEWAKSAAGDPHIRAAWQLDNHRRLLLCDARKFGRITLADDLADLDRRVGLEPLERSFTPAALAAVLRSRRRLLKPLLLDQSLIAGLGNIYTDEALHRAGLHPLTHSDRLSDQQIAALHEAIRYALRAGLRHNGTSIDWVYPGGRMQNHLAAYGRDGRPCRRCGATIELLRVGQRSTHICPVCQPAPRRRRRTARSGESTARNGRSRTTPRPRPYTPQRAARRAAPSRGPTRHRATRARACAESPAS